VSVGINRPQVLEKVIDVPALDPNHRDDLLCQHIKGTNNRQEGFDILVRDFASEHGGLEKILGMSGKQGAPADLAHPVPRTPHPLDSRRN